MWHRETHPVANGLVSRRRPAAGRPSRPRSRRRSSGWRARTRAGATGTSRASWPISATGSPRDDPRRPQAVWCAARGRAAAPGHQLARLPRPASGRHPRPRLLRRRDALPQGDLIVLFFIELGARRGPPRRLHGGPTAAWVAQQARHVSWRLQEGELAARVLIRDRDAKSAPAFDAAFRSEGMRVVRAPYRAPRANAVAERWVRSTRQECLDHLLVVNEGHLRHILGIYPLQPRAAPSRAWPARPWRGRRQLGRGRCGVGTGWAACCAPTIEKRRRPVTARTRFRALQADERGGRLRAVAAPGCPAR